MSILLTQQLPQPNVILETMKGWMPAFLGLGQRLLIAAVIILIGMRLAKSLNRIMQRTFERMKFDVSLSKFLLSLVRAGVYVIVFFIAAEQFGIPSASIIALLGSATLAVGLALQGSLANFAGGILILVMRPFGVGDYIVSEEAEGTVVDIGLVYTTLVTVDNKKITIPNGSLSNSVVTNATVQEKRRVDILVGIGYESDLQQAKGLVEQIYNSHPLVHKEPEIQVFVDNLGESAVMIGARGWTNTEDYWQVRWDILETIKHQFDQAGIAIAYRQLDVHVR